MIISVQWIADIDYATSRCAARLKNMDLGGRYLHRKLNEQLMLMMLPYFRESMHRLCQAPAVLELERFEVDEPSCIIYSFLIAD